MVKSNLESISPLERKLNIEVPASEVQAAFERAIEGIQRHVAIKGFRKGKAPISTVKSIYGDRVKQDVAQDIIQTHYATALKEHSLDPISYPAIEFDAIELDKNFAFTAEFEVRPEVKLKQVEGLQVKREKFEVNDDLVNTTIEDIRKARAETGPMLEDRAAQNGDVAVIDFKGFVDGKELDNGAAEGHELELGSNSFIPGFEEGIVGMRVGGNTRVKIAFPAQYHVAELAGKPVEFDVVLKGLKKKTLPELNDEFAKSVGNYENMEALKTAIREDFEKRESKRIADDLKNRIMKVLVDRNPVEVPKALLVDQKKALVDDFKNRLQQQGMGDSQYDEYKDKWNADFEQTASYMIQSSFLVDKIAADQSFRATPADVEAKLKEYAQQTGIEFARIQEFYGDQDKKARLAYQITEEKVLDFLISKAKIQDVSKEEIQKEDAKEA
ncbi:MAG TPA: trigger factor [Bdellovibrionales bacterium]|nr:trigger factor [Bdellovibrionales bacterium]